jgi:hypothetical protein
VSFDPCEFTLHTVANAENNDCTVGQPAWQESSKVKSQSRDFRFKHHRCVPKDNEFRCLANGRYDQGGCRAKWNNCVPQDIDTSCRYDNDPRWFPQALYVTESHHKVKSQSRDFRFIFDEKWRSTLRLKYVGLQ